MHPWRKIIRGNNAEQKTQTCFMCLERIPCSDDDIQIKIHLFKVHSSKAHLKELVEMCLKAEEREDRKGWSLDDILKEERVRREAEDKIRVESGWIGIFKKKERRSECLDNNKDIDCFLCQEKLIMIGWEYENHLVSQHKAIFGLRDIKKLGEKTNFLSNKETNEIETEKDKSDIFRTDADIVKELVEIKYLQKKKVFKITTPTLGIFSNKYKVLKEEVSLIHCIFLIFKIHPFRLKTFLSMSLVQYEKNGTHIHVHMPLILVILSSFV